MNSISSLVKSNIRLIFFSLLALFLIVVFKEALFELLSRVTNEERYSHAPMVFLMALYLIWIKRLEIDYSNQGAWYGVLIVSIASTFLLVGQLSAIWTIVQYSVLLLMLGVVLSTIGYQFRKVLIPFLHLFLVIPLPYMLDVMLSGKMQLVSSTLGVEIIRFFGYSVYQDGNVIDLGGYKLQVVEACSGLNYMYPLMTISLMMAYMYKAPFFARTLIFLSSVPISVLMNSFRIAIVALLVNSYGNEAASGFMHYFEGWIIFGLCIFTVLFEIKILNRLLKIHPKFADSFDYLETRNLDNANKIASNNVFKMFPVIVSIAILMVACLSSLAVEQRQEIKLPRQSFAQFPTSFDTWEGQLYSFKNNEDDILKLKDYLLISFHKEKKIVDLYIGYTDSQRNGSVPHSPKACIPGGGWEISNTSLKSINIDKNVNFKVTRMLISKGETKQVVYYWFHQRGRNLSNEFSMKFALLYDAIKLNRTDGAIVRFSSPVLISEEETDKDIEEMIRLTYPHFYKYIPSSN